MTKDAQARTEDTFEDPDMYIERSKVMGSVTLVQRNISSTERITQLTQS